MAKFSNGTEGLNYQNAYCWQCAHWSDERGCPCWSAHELWNSDEINKTDSILHKMIPVVGIINGKCFCFNPVAKHDTASVMADELDKKAACIKVLDDVDNGIVIGLEQAARFIREQEAKGKWKE
jgi:hypothetical protein